LDHLTDIAVQQDIAGSIDRLTMALERLIGAVEQIRDLMLEEMEEDGTEDVPSPT
jgi:hypothetical protein